MLWITGAKGLLGSALATLCKAALHTGREVDISTVTPDFVKGKGITHIINCAAFSLVDAAETRREEAWRANSLGPENLARLANDIEAKLIHISTDYVFSGNTHRLLNEKDPVAPCNYYGETKLEGERRALELGACVVRTSGIFGTGGKNFVCKLLHMLQTESEVRLTDDQWGKFTYAPDLATALLQMLDRKGLYQYANDGVVTKYEFGTIMREEALRLGYDVKAKVTAVPGSTFKSPCKRPAYSAFDTTKIEQYVPVRHYKEALREFLCAQLPAYS